MVIYAIITMVADDRLVMAQVIMSGSKQHLHERRILNLGPVLGDLLIRSGQNSKVVPYAARYTLCASFHRGFS